MMRLFNSFVTITCHSGIKHSVVENENWPALKATALKVLSKFSICDTLNGIKHIVMFSIDG